MAGAPRRNDRRVSLARARPALKTLPPSGYVGWRAPCLQIVRAAGRSEPRPRDPRSLVERRKAGFGRARALVEAVSGGGRGGGARNAVGKRADTITIHASAGAGRDRARIGSGRMGRGSSRRTTRRRSRDRWKGRPATRSARGSVATRPYRRGAVSTLVRSRELRRSDEGADARGESERH